MVIAITQGKSAALCIAVIFSYGCYPVGLEGAVYRMISKFQSVAFCIGGIFCHTGQDIAVIGKAVAIGGFIGYGSQVIIRITKAYPIYFFFPCAVVADTAK